MSIFDKLFGAAPSATPAQQPAQPQQTPQPGNMDPAKANPTDPANPMVPAGTVEASKSPLDTFNELWQPPTPDANANQPLINVDPAKLAEAARKTDFSKMITPEQLSAIQAGGENAAAAFAQAMNQVAQGVYAQSAFATTKIVEQAVARAQEKFMAEVPAHVKKLQVSDTLRQENPVFNHPAASPILSAVEAQLTVKYPNASASELTSMAKQYLENFAGAINAPAEAAKAAAAKKDSKETDWNSFLS